MADAEAKAPKGPQVRRTAPFGTWESPIGARDVAVSAWRPSWTDFVGDELWWTIPTPAEGGRVRLFRETAGGSAPVLPEPWSVRTAFVEYGGRPFAGYVGENGSAVVFTEWSDQRLYLFEPDAPQPAPRPLTPEPALPSAIRYVDPLIVAERGEVWCVREEFHSTEPTDVTRAIVAVPLDGSCGVRILISGDTKAQHFLTQHFLTNVRRSPDGRRLAWIGWDHPDMPWDSATLCVAELDDRGADVVGGIRRVAGGSGVAVAQAEWLDADTLVYASDDTDWWNLYTARWDGTGVRRVVEAEEEFGGPAWQPGQRWFALLPETSGAVPGSSGRVAAIHGRTVKSVSVYEIPSGELVRDIDAPYTSWCPTLVARGNRVACQAGSPTIPFEIVAFDADSGAVEVVSAGDDPFGPAWVSEPYVVTIHSPHEREIHANVYPPANPGYAGGADGERPPYVVFVHGGPTGSASLVYDLEISYFTSRGLGVVDVNYGGSTGYGRAYRERLRGQWGVVDVEDCAAVVNALVAEGVADGARIAIRGGSAGGWTSAAALAADPRGEIYRCAAIRFPVLDPVTWRVGGTHDLESRYLDGLIGPWPQARERYRQVSPLERADGICVPFILLQGMQDAICPPEQTRVFLDRVKGGKVPFAYLAFEGEQHGFRLATTIAAALEAELSLYGQAMGFDPPGVARLELGS